MNIYSNTWIESVESGKKECANGEVAVAIISQTHFLPIFMAPWNNCKKKVIHFGKILTPWKSGNVIAFNEGFLILFSDRRERSNWHIGYLGSNSRFITVFLYEDK